MPSYRIHRLKEHLRQPFRSAPHVSGLAHVKPRDYEPGDSIAASGPYAAYFDRKETADPLMPGDLLESETGSLLIFKFVGFEAAEWVRPEVAPEAGADAAVPAETALK